MVDVSLLVPAIRTDRWEAFYKSALDACKRNTFEVVFISPFDLPPSLEDKPNVKIIKDFGSPSRATSIGVESCEGEFLYNCVDDGIFFEDCIDAALDHFGEHCCDIDLINMRYRESTNADRTPFPMSYWDAWPNGLAYPGVHPSWKIALHFFIKKDYYNSLGGLDCQFEYVNHGVHDLVFRAQAKGSGVHMSPIEGLNCTHYEGTSADHAPIHNAQISHDEPLFQNLYQNSDAAHRSPETLLKWRDCPEVWERRFSAGVPKTYEELLNVKS
tara:strand:- start:512 stop:1324 length:813 start_codon:yes stop_codon:yes gene_type:complete